MKLVREMVGYRPRINNKKDAKCLDTNLLNAPESELVLTKPSFYCLSRSCERLLTC